ncbi:hypothetical protein DPMN_191528 [Dreissena polymorpha]|uniref:Uncharacterized protein n=1 Tax=Dreissena polymorpha TaxID=45954 RepID=A0A9D4B513_DREPO|nr:hypothetical protein DPMN_191528 [Dreissena polymorpha]
MKIGHKMETAPPSGGHFELSQDINRTYVLTKFHEHWAIHLTSRVLTRVKLPLPYLAAMFFNELEPFQDIIRTNVLTKVLTRFYYYIIETNGLTQFHEDWK